MNFSQPTSPASTWAAATRTLTGNGTAITINGGLDNQSLANGSTANFLSSAGTMAIMTIVGIAAANVTWNIGLTNGASFRQGVSGSSGAALMFHGANSTLEGMAINNSGTVSGNYSLSRCIWNT